MPEHLRVLGGARGDLPDPRGQVHPAVRVLRRDDGQARRGGRGRARQDRGRRSRDGAALRRRHRAWRATTSPTAARGIWASTIRAIREAVPDCGVEVLPTDFKGGERDIATVIEAEPDVFAHNLETVRRLHGRIRPAFGYDRTLEVLRIAQRLREGQVTKSNLILGMGERPDEIPQALRDLADAGVRDRHDRPVPPPDRTPPAGGPVGAPGRVRAVEGARGIVRDRPRRGRTLRAELVPRRQAVPTGDLVGLRWEEPACTPDPVPARGPVATICLSALASAPGPKPSCGLPGSSDGPSSNAPCLA